MGRVTYAPEFGSITTSAGWSGMEAATSYFKTTSQNRTWNRAMVEFAVPNFQDWNIVSARLRFRRDSSGISLNRPDDPQKVGAYGADLSLTTADYSRPVTRLYTFSTNQHFSRANQQFDFDVTQFELVVQTN